MEKKHIYLRPGQLNLAVEGIYLRPDRLNLAIEAIDHDWSAISGLVERLERNLEHRTSIRTFFISPVGNDVEGSKPSLEQLVALRALVTQSRHRLKVVKLNIAREAREIEGTDASLGWLSWWIPRKHREALMGDIREDIAELRTSGTNEWRVRWIICWQLFIAFLQWPLLWKASLWTCLAATVRRWLSP